MPKNRTPYIFLSHNSVDKPQVEKIAHRLKDSGFKVWLDKWNLIPGDPWQEGIEDALNECNCCLVFVGKEGNIGPWQNVEMRAAIDHQVSTQRLRVIPVLLPNSERGDKSQLPTFLVRNGWVEFRYSLDEPETFARLIAGIKGVKPSIKGDLIDVENPYRGLQVFDVKHSRFFFGRSVVVEWLLDTIRPSDSSESSARFKDNRFLAIIGASGSGKSSVARAGLLAALRNGQLPNSERWPIIIVKPGEKPLQSLALSIISHSELPEYCRTELPALIDKFYEQPLGLHYLALEWLKGNERQRLVILIDQFEEVFTLCKDEVERKIFIDILLNSAYESTGQVIVIKTLRADFYPNLTPHDRLSRAIEAHQYLLNPLSEDELTEAITMPAQLSGAEVHQLLVEDLVKDTIKQPGSLPLLQFALSQLWEQRSGRILQLQEYRLFGGLTGVLEEQANKVYEWEDYPKKIRRSHKSQTQLRLVFRRLVQIGEGSKDIRRRALINEFSEEQKKIIRLMTSDKFRLLTTQRKNGEEFVEVAHEALIGGWKRLERWISGDRASIQTQNLVSSAAKEWDNKGKKVKGLLPEARLLDAENWLEDYPEQSSPLEKAFVKSESRLVRKQRNRVKWFAAVMAVVAAAMLFLASLYRDQSHELELETQRVSLAKEQTELALEKEELARKSADINTKKAEAASIAAEIEAKNAKEAEERALLAKSVANKNARLARTQEREANLNLAQAYEQRAKKSIELYEKNREEGFFIESKNEAKKSLLFALESLKIKNENNFSKLDIKFLGRLAGIDEQDLFDNEKEIQKFAIDSDIKNIAFYDEGKKFVTASKSGELSFWDSEKGKVIRSIDAHDAPIEDISISNNGQLIATSSASLVNDDNTIKVWDKDGKEISEFSKHLGGIWGVGFSNDDKYVYSSSEDGTVLYWNIKSGEILNSFSFDHGTLYALDVSPKDDLLTFIIWGSEEIHVWDPRSVTMPQKKFQLDRPFSFINKLTYNDEGSRVLLSDKRSFYLLDAINWTLIKKDTIKNDEITDLAFDTDGSKFYMATKKGYIHVWALNNLQEKITIKAVDREIKSIDVSLSKIIVAGLGFIKKIDKGASAEKDECFFNGASSVNPKESILVTESTKGNLCFYRFDENRFTKIVELDVNDIDSLKYSEDGVSLLVVSGFRVILLTMDGTNVLNKKIISGYDSKLLEIVSFNPDEIIFLVKEPKAGFLDLLKLDISTEQISIIRKIETEDLLKVAYSATSKRFAYNSSDYLVKVFNSENLPVRVLNTKGKTNLGSYDFSKYIHLADVDKKPVSSNVIEPENYGQVESLSFNSKGSHLSVLTDDGLIRILDLANKDNDLVIDLKRFYKSSEGKGVSRFSQDGSFLVIAKNDYLVLVDLKSGIIKNTYKSMGGDVYFTKNEKYIVSIGNNISFFRLNSESSEEIVRSDFKINDLVISPKGEVIFYGGEDKKILGWDLLKNQKFGEVKLSEDVHSIDINSDGFSLVAGLNNNKAAIVSITGSAFREEINYIDYGERKPLSLEEKDEHGNVKSTIAELLPTGMARPPVRSVSFLDGDKQVIAATENKIKLYNVIERTISTVVDHETSIEHMEYSNNLTSVFSSSGKVYTDDNRIKITNLSSGKMVENKGKYGRWNSLVSLSPNGDNFASVSHDTIFSWNFDPVESKIRKLKGEKYDGHISSLAYSNDGKLIASGFQDGLIMLLDSSSLKPYRFLRGHSGYITGLVFDNDNLYSSSHDGTIRRWVIKSNLRKIIYDFNPEVVSKALKLLWKLDLDGFEVKSVNRNPSIEPIRGYYFEYDPKYYSLLEPPRPNETKMDQLVRWLKDQMAYHENTLGVPQ